MSPAAISLTVLVGSVALFVWNRLPVEIVAMAVALTLWATGVIDLHGAFAGFGDPVIIFLAALFVVSEGIDATGITAWTSRRIESIVGKDRRRLLVLTMLLGAGMSCLISPNGAVAALLPMCVMTAKRSGQSPSLVAMPLAFASGAGALLVLTGSPINLMASKAASDSGADGFTFLAFVWVGIPLVAGTIAICVLLAPRLLRARMARGTTADLSQHAETLAEEYGPLAATTLDERRGVVEVIVPPRSMFVGDKVGAGHITEDGLEVVAVQRGGVTLEELVPLRVGDTLLLRGPWDRLERSMRDKDVLVVDAPLDIRRQALPMGPRAGRALLILAGMVLVLALDLAPAAIAALVAAGLMVLTRVVRLDQAYDSISWTTVLLIAGMIPLSAAIQDSGAADLIGEQLVATVGTAGPYAVMLAIFVVIAVLGQFVSNTATALIVIPIAQSSAAAMSLSPRPFMMLVAVASAASLLTPIATPANMMVMNPGGYKFGDYWKLGLPILLWYLVVCLVVIPLVWPFRA